MHVAKSRPIEHLLLSLEKRNALKIAEQYFPMGANSN